MDQLPKPELQIPDKTPRRKQLMFIAGAMLFFVVLALLKMPKNKDKPVSTEVKLDEHSTPEAIARRYPDNKPPEIETKHWAPKKLVGKEIESSPQYLVAEEYLNANVNDPRSLIIASYSEIAELDDGLTAIRIRYRAKNAFGALVLEDKVFGFDKNHKVVYVKDFMQK
jgi:hypothetical protein